MPLPLGGMRYAKRLAPISAAYFQDQFATACPDGLDHRATALKYAMQFARDMESELADHSSACTSTMDILGYGEKGKHAVQNSSRVTNAASSQGGHREFLSDYPPIRWWLRLR